MRGPGGSDLPCNVDEEEQDDEASDERHRNVQVEHHHLTQPIGIASAGLSLRLPSRCEVPSMLPRTEDTHHEGVGWCTMFRTAPKSALAQW